MLKCKDKKTKKQSIFLGDKEIIIFTIFALHSSSSFAAALTIDENPIIPLVWVSNSTNFIKLPKENLEDTKHFTHLKCPGGVNIIW